MFQLSSGNREFEISNRKLRLSTWESLPSIEFQSASLRR
jgi:hypothetical protein